MKKTEAVKQAVVQAVSKYGRAVTSREVEEFVDASSVHAFLRLLVKKGEISCERTDDRNYYNCKTQQDVSPPKTANWLETALEFHRQSMVDLVGADVAVEAHARMYRALANGGDELISMQADIANFYIDRMLTCDLDAVEFFAEGYRYIVNYTKN